MSSHERNMSTSPDVLDSPQVAAVNPMDSRLKSFKLNRSITTVQDCWREYSIGLGIEPIAVRTLDETNETFWRSKDPEKRFYYRRKLIWDKIKELINGGMTENAAVDCLELRLITMGRFIIN